MAEKKRPVVLVVCYGNICRSPMAAGLLRRALAAAGAAEVWEVASAGVGAQEGLPAAPGALAAAAAHGIDIADHTARRLTPDMARAADHIIAMDEVVEEEILIRTRDAVEVELWPVDDPFGGPEAGYARAFADIRLRVEEWVERHVVAAPDETRTDG